MVKMKIDKEVLMKKVMLFLALIFVLTVLGCSKMESQDSNHPYSDANTTSEPKKEGDDAIAEAMQLAYPKQTFDFFSSTSTQP